MSDVIDAQSIEYSNSVANFYRFVDNLRQHPQNTKEMVDEYRDTVLYLANKFPYIWRAWSDNPEGLEYVKQETARRIALIKAKGTT